MGVAAEIGQHLLRPAEGRLGVDDPFEATDFGQQAGEGIGLCQVGEIAEEAQAARIDGRLAVASRKSRRNRRDSTRTGRKKPGRQEIQRVPSRRDATARHDAMQVGMIGEGSGPSCAAPR